MRDALCLRTCHHCRCGRFEAKKICSVDSFLGNKGSSDDDTNDSEIRLMGSVAGPPSKDCRCRSTNRFDYFWYRYFFECSQKLGSSTLRSSEKFCSLTRELFFNFSVFCHDAQVCVPLLVGLCEGQHSKWGWPHGRYGGKVHRDAQLKNSSY